MRSPQAPERPESPASPSVNRRAIPDELKKLPQWVGWSWKKIVGKDGNVQKTKVPYDLKTGRAASHSDSSTWASYEETKGHDLIGFVFSENDPYVGIDLDKCIEDGEVSPEAERIVRSFSSYSEISPSGTGIKIFVRGKLPGRSRRSAKKNIEIYDQNRFFTVTGNVYSSYSGPIARGTSSLKSFYEKTFPETVEPEKNGRGSSVSGIVRDAITNRDLTDEDVLSLAVRARNGEKFERLYSGDWEGIGYGSHSEADLALCSMLAFYCGPDPERIEEMFSGSDLSRGKWFDRPQYRKTTITKALSDMTEFYSPTTGGTYTFSGFAGDPTEDEVSGSGVTPPFSSFPAPLPEAPSFPVESLPDSCRPFVEEVASCVGCPIDYVALPVLASLSSGIGASRVVEIKRGWRESTSLFLAVVGEPGAKKTPPQKMATRPVRKRDFRHQKDFERKWGIYEYELENHDAVKKAAKKRGEIPPEEPEKPKAGRCQAVDVTVEAMIEMLAENPRGILVERDELTGWVRAMDQYKGGKGSDKQHWLSLWSSSSITVDRKGQAGRPISVEQPTVTLCGSIQPRMLRELGETSEEGMIERFLFAYPEHKRQRFTYDELSVEAEQQYESLYESLCDYQMGEDPVTGREEPGVIRMSPAARELFALCSDRLSMEMEEPGFPHRLRGAFSKLEAYLARLALILGMCRIKEDDDVEQVEREDVEAAHDLIRYFAGHARRIHGQMGGTTPEEHSEEILNKLIEKNGEEIWEGTSEMLLEDLQEYGASGIPDTSRAIGRWVRSICERSTGLSLIEKNVRNREDERRKGFKLSKAPTQSTLSTLSTQERQDE